MKIPKPSQSRRRKLLLQKQFAAEVNIVYTCNKVENTTRDITFDKLELFVVFRNDH